MPTTDADAIQPPSVLPALPSSRTGSLRFNYWSWWIPLFLLAWLAGLFTFFPHPGDLVREHWPLLFVGFLGATIGNATAVGGGLVYIPAMIFLYGVSPVTALKLALASQVFGMTSGAIGWARRGVVPFGALWVAVPALLVGSTISALIIQPSSLLVKGLFGPVSILIGVITLVLLDRHGNRESLPARAYAGLMPIAMLGGLLTGWIAIGEGEVVAAFLMLAYGLRAERGIGLGVVLLAINSIFLTLLHHSFLGGIPWDMVFITGLGSALGGRMGPYLSQWIGPRRLKIGFAAVAILDGFVFLLQFLVL